MYLYSKMLPNKYFYNIYASVWFVSGNILIYLCISALVSYSLGVENKLSPNATL